eukprot:TRINITY_DN42277_c0_g1_i1.p1 TRINITY_DN42277_c0_g1~~TRINITY_DN42277_c0_g1_i1.p1  ORF type:complete len:888 (-),score=121.96 TRINITY_DN42277_c0_g1_i1:62-2725(-)
MRLCPESQILKASLETIARDLDSIAGGGLSGLQWRWSQHSKYRLTCLNRNKHRVLSRIPQRRLCASAIFPRTVREQGVTIAASDSDKKCDSARETTPEGASSHACDAQVDGVSATTLAKGGGHESRSDVREALRTASFANASLILRAQGSRLDEASLFLGMRRVIRELERLQKLRRWRLRRAQEEGEEGIIAIDSQAEEASNLAWPLLNRCRRLLERDVSHSAKFLSGLAWALAKLAPILQPRTGSLHTSREDCSRFTPGVLMRKIVRRALNKGLSELDGRQIAIVVWSAASLQREDDQALPPKERTELLQALGENVVLRLPEMSAQGLPMMLWALAVIDSSVVSVKSTTKPVMPVPRVLFSSLADEAGQRTDDLSAREVANVAWAFATIQLRMPVWLEEELPERAPEFRPQECANVLWALAATSLPVTDVVGALSLPANGHDDRTSHNDDLGGYFARWKAQEMANAAWALAVSREDTSATLRSCAGKNQRAAWIRTLRFAVAERASELNGLELAMVASTIPDLGCSDSTGRDVGEDEVSVAETTAGEAHGVQLLLDGISCRAATLLEAQSLPANAALQVTDCLERCGVAVPSQLIMNAEQHHLAATSAIHLLAGTPVVAASNAITAEISANTAADATPSLPAAQPQNIFTAECGISDTEKSAALRELQRVGLTTLGARRTSRLLASLGMPQGAPITQPVAPKSTDGASPQGFGGEVTCLLAYHLLLSSALQPDKEDGCSSEVGEATTGIGVTNANGQVSKQQNAERDSVHWTLVQPGQRFCSGGQQEPLSVGALFAVELRFPRHRDAEFLALNAVVADIRKVAAEAQVADDTLEVHGNVRLQVSHTPCLSCVGAMVQFQRKFPFVKLHVNFDARDGDVADGTCILR